MKKIILTVVLAVAVAAIAGGGVWLIKNNRMHARELVIIRRASGTRCNLIIHEIEHDLTLLEKISDEDLRKTMRSHIIDLYHELIYELKMDPVVLTEDGSGDFKEERITEQNIHNHTCTASIRSFPEWSPETRKRISNQLPPSRQ